MGKERVNIIGKRFGNLVVLSHSHTKGYTRYFLCQCDCGNQTIVAKNALTTGKQVSCGCLRKKRLGDLNRLPNGYLRLGKIYRAMKKRCYDTKSNRYDRYGARGIKICDEWLSDINAFRKWSIENGYKDGLSIDRIDNNGDYSPNNCRWVEPTEQSNNTSRTVMIEYNGKTQTLTQWANELNIPKSTLHNRLRVHGWSVERALTQPVRNH
jgi:hypothetical protein